MKLLLKICSTLICVISIGFAHGAQQGSYIGGLVGYSTSDYGGGTTAKVDDSGTGYRLQAGYQFNANYAFEIGYIRFHTVNISRIGGVAGASSKITPQSMDANGKVIIPLSSAASTFGKVGLAYAETKGSGAGVSDGHSFRPIYGLGASYEFYPNMVAEVSWMQIPKGGSIRRTDIVAFGLSYFFG